MITTRKEILRQVKRHNLALANMDGPLTVGRAGWINPFGFFILSHLPLTQPCKAEIPRIRRVNHTRARDRGLCSARKNHAKDRTWSSDRERDDFCWTAGLSVVRCWQGRFQSFPQCRPTPALQWARCRSNARSREYRREE